MCKKRPTKRPTKSYLKVVKFKLQLPNPSRPTNTIYFHTFIKKRLLKIGTFVKIPTNAWDTASQCIIANNDMELLQAEQKLDNAVHALKKCYRNIQLNDDTELTVDSMGLAAERWKEGLQGHEPKTSSTMLAATLSMCPRNWKKLRQWLQ